MLIFLFGQDTFRLQNKLNEIIQYYQKINKGGLNLKLFEKDDLDFQNFKNILNSPSIFKEKKLIVLKDIFSNQIFKNEFLKQKEKILGVNDIIVIYERNEISKKDALFQFLKKNARCQEFKLLDNEKLKNWVKKEFIHYKTEIEISALEKLIEFVGNNLWQMETEIKKLISYKRNQKIQVKDVELLVNSKIETDIFKTISALIEKRKKIALTLIHRHLESGDHPLYLLKMISYQFRNLLEIKELIEKKIPYYKILNQSGLNPFVIKKNYQLAQRFTLAELKKIYQKIFQVDFDIKTGKIEPEAALDLLIAGL